MNAFFKYYEILVPTLEGVTLFLSQQKVDKNAYVKIFFTDVVLLLRLT